MTMEYVSNLDAMQFIKLGMCLKKRELSTDELRNYGLIDDCGMTEMGKLFADVPEGRMNIEYSGINALCDEGVLRAFSYLDVIQRFRAVFASQYDARTARDLMHHVGIALCEMDPRGFIAMHIDCTRSGAQIRYTSGGRFQSSKYLKNLLEDLDVLQKNIDHAACNYIGNQVIVSLNLKACWNSDFAA